MRPEGGSSFSSPCKKHNSSLFFFFPSLLLSVLCSNPLPLLLLQSQRLAQICFLHCNLSFTAINFFPSGHKIIPDASESGGQTNSKLGNKAALIPYKFPLKNLLLKKKKKALLFRDLWPRRTTGSNQYWAVGGLARGQGSSKTWGAARKRQIFKS